MLLRPYLLKVGAYLQEKDMEKQDKVHKVNEAVDDIEEAERETESLAWGAQRRIRRKLDEEYQKEELERESALDKYD